MKTLIAALAAVLLATAAPAAATTFITESGPAADGSLSWDFGNDGGIPAGAFEDTFDIFLPAAGLGDGSVTATFTSKSTELKFTAVSFAGLGFTLFNFSGEHGGDLAPTAVLGGHQLLDIKGVSPGIAGDYTGTLSFTPGGVPEPATWALMILGFGGAGAMLRRRKVFAVPRAPRSEFRRRDRQPYSGRIHYSFRAFRDGRTKNLRRLHRRRRTGTAEAIADPSRRMALA